LRFPSKGRHENENHRRVVSSGGSSAERDARQWKPAEAGGWTDCNRHDLIAKRSHAGRDAKRQLLRDAQRGAFDIDAELPGIIRRYNESVGGVNSDSEGYHETITRVFLHGVRLFLAEANPRKPLHELVNELLRSPMGRRDWPLRFYTPQRLFSVEARRKFIPPDLAALP